MPQKDGKPEDGEVVEEIEECDEQHVADLDEPSRRFLATFTTIRSKLDDLSRAESELSRFELSIESQRKLLRKNAEAARLALRNARIQMGAELAKADAAGFSQISELIKNREGAVNA